MLATLLALAAPFALPIQDTPQRSYSKAMSALVAAAQPEHQPTVVRWGTWGEAHGYELELVAEASLLVVHPKKGSIRKELGLAGKVLERADELFPALIPIDALGGLGAVAPRAGDAWTVAAPPELPVVFLVDGDQDYGSLLSELATEHAYLRDWIPAARGQAGFVLPEPLACAVLTKGADLEEWNPENELVNRLTRLLLLQRYGRLPEWLSAGLAWNFELELTGGLYCFPRRQGFVSILEHDDWDKALRARFKNVKDWRPTARDLMQMDRGEFKTEPAQLAWAAGTFLAEHCASELPELLEALAEDYRVHSRRDLGGGRWELDTQYVTPAETQAQILESTVDPGFFSELAEFVMLGKRYRRSRR